MAKINHINQLCNALQKWPAWYFFKWQYTVTDLLHTTVLPLKANIRLRCFMYTAFRLTFCSHGKNSYCHAWPGRDWTFSHASYAYVQNWAHACTHTQYIHCMWTNYKREKVSFTTCRKCRKTHILFSDILKDFVEDCLMYSNDRDA